jgi:hypothetical protein
MSAARSSATNPAGIFAPTSSRASAEAVVAAPPAAVAAAARGLFAMHVLTSSLSKIELSVCTGRVCSATMATASVKIFTNIACILADFEAESAANSLRL